MTGIKKKNFKFYFKKALEYMNKDNLENSLKYYNKSLELNPQHSNSWANKSKVLYGMKNYSAALINADKTIELNPQDYVAWNIKGLVLKKEDKIDDAFKCFEKSIDYFPNVSAFFNKGIILFDQNKNDEAFECFLSAYGFEPDNKHIIGKLLLTLERKEEYDEAINYLKQFQTKNYDDFETWSNIGYFLEKKGDLEEALEFYNKSVEIAPKFRIGWENIGKILQRLKKWEESLVLFKKASLLDENNPLIKKSISISYFNIGDLQNALKTLDNAIQLNSDNEELWEIKTQILIKQNNYGFALASIQCAIDIDPNNAHNWNNKGIILKKLNRNIESIKTFNKAIELNSKITEYYLNKSSVLNRLSRLKEEEELLKKALEIESNNYKIYVSLGSNQDSQKKYKDAIINYKKAIKINAKDNSLWVSLGLSYEESGNQKEALECFNKALDIDNKDILALTYKSMVLKSYKRYHQALEYINHALDIRSDVLEIWFNKALIYKDMGNFKEEIESYNHALSINSRDVRVLNNKAIASQNLGDFDESLKLFNLVLESDPNNKYVLSNKTVLLSERKDYNKTKELYEFILGHNPKFIECKINFAVLFIDLHKYDIAIEKIDELKSQLKDIKPQLIIIIDKIYAKANNAKNLLIALEDVDDYFLQALDSNTLYQLHLKSKKLSETINKLIMKFNNKKLPKDLIDLLNAKKNCFEFLRKALNFEDLNLKLLEKSKNVFNEWNLNSFIIAVNSLENFYLKIKEFNTLEDITSDTEKRLLLLLKNIHFLNGDLSSVILNMFKTEYIYKTIDSIENIVLKDYSIELSKAKKLWEKLIHFFDKEIDLKKIPTVKFQNENDLNAYFYNLMEIFPNVELNKSLSGKSHIDLAVDNKVAIEIKKVESKTAFDELTGQIMEDINIGDFKFGIAYGIDETASEIYTRFNKKYFGEEREIVYIFKPAPY